MIGPSSSPVTGSPDYIQTANTAAILRGMDANLVAKLWEKRVTWGERRAMVWDKHTGMRDCSPIWQAQDLSKGAGHTMYFRAAADYDKEVLRGENLFLAPEQFERESMLAYALVVERSRSAHSISDHAEPHLGIVGEITKGIDLRMGDRWGRKRDEDIDMMFLLKTPASNIGFARGRAGFGGLRIGDTLRHEDITSARYALARIAKPCMVKKDSQGNKISNFLFHSPSDALYGLRNDLINNGILTDADVRGAGNHTFKGGWLELDGQTIEERHVLDASTKGPWGCPLTPRASLGRGLIDGVVTSGDGGPAVVNGTEVWGGHHPEWTKELYYLPMKHFPGWGYEWGYSLAAHDYSTAVANTPGKAPKYALIYNRAGTDKGKFGMVEYNTIESVYGRYLNVTKYLRSANGGAQSRGYAQVGNVIWDADKNTTTHDASSAMVIPCTENGVPFAYNLVLGAGAAMCGYGETRNKREQERFNGLVTRRYLDNVHGQALRYDAAFRVPGLMVIVSAIQYADMPINPTLAS